MMAKLPEKSPGAGWWEYGRQTLRRIADAMRWVCRKLLRNRVALMKLINMAQAIVKLIDFIMELFRRF
jgi:hypothetical protein